MQILLVGAGVIRTVYGAHLAASGHEVAVLSHEPRTGEIARDGLTATDLITGTRTTAAARVLADPSGTRFDLVLVSVRAGQLAGAAGRLAGLPGRPAVLFFGNNPAGLAGLPDGLPGPAFLGFPGIGGSLADGTAGYQRIRQQPTTLEAGGPDVLSTFAAAIESCGFPVTRTASIDGWLAFHAIFVGSVAAALRRCGGSAAALASDRAVLRLMCRSVEEGFAVLSAREFRACRAI